MQKILFLKGIIYLFSGLSLVRPTIFENFKEEYTLMGSKDVVKIPLKSTSFLVFS